MALVLLETLIPPSWGGLLLRSVDSKATKAESRIPSPGFREESRHHSFLEPSCGGRYSQLHPGTWRESWAEGCWFWPALLCCSLLAAVEGGRGRISSA